MTIQFDFQPFEFITSKDIDSQVSSLGGYYKETISLSKRSRRILNDIHRCKEIWVANQIYSKNYLDEIKDFYLNILISQRLTIPTGSQLIQREIIQTTNYPIYSYPREKITISNETTSLLKWVGMNSFAELPPKEFISTIVEKDVLSSYIIELLQISNIKIHNIIFEPFISKLERKTGNILEESLPKVVTFEEVEKLHHLQEFKFCNFEEFRMMTIQKDTTVNRRQHYITLDNWTSKVEWGINTYMSNLTFSLFDEKFNKLEMYKIPYTIPTLKESHKMPTIIYTVWSIEKHILKKMGWNPMKQCSFKSLYELSVNDEINKVPFNIMPLAKKHFPIYNGVLDILTGEGNNFATLNIDFKVIDPEATNKTSVHSSYNVEASSSSDNTQLPINTSLLAQKRSFIDEEISFMSERKTRKIEDRDLNKTSTSCLLNIIDCGTYQFETDPMEISSSENSQHNNVINILPIPEITIKSLNRVIILNSNRVFQNHSILQYLQKYEELCIIERPSTAEYDFVFQNSTSLIRVQINKLFQSDKKGNLYYHDTFQRLSHEFFTVIVLVEFTSTIEKYDKDIFRKTQLLFDKDRYVLHFINTDSQYEKLWFPLLIQKYSSSGYEESQFNDLTEDQIILTDLNYFNPLLVQTLLPPSTSFRELLQSLPDKAHLLTPYQQSIIRHLLSLNW